MMVTEVDTVTAPVVTVKVALLSPTGTVTLVGTVAAAMSLLSITVVVVPEDELSVTVPIEDSPPTTVLGFNVSEETLCPNS